MAFLANITAAHARASANIRGALWMVLSALTFTVMTTLIKYLGADYSAALQTFYRQVAACLVLLPLIARDPIAALRTTRPGIILFRSLAGTVGTILSFWAFQKLPLAEANALSFTRTLWIVPLAIFVLREFVGPWRIGATMVGFAGTLLMLQPAVATNAGWPAAAALTAALLFSMTIAGMKVVARDHSVMTLTVWSAFLGLLLSTPMALLEWRWPTLPDLALLCAMGVLGLINQFCYIKGMAIGDAAAMAPLDYTRLIFAVIIGLVFFHEIPNAVTMLGAAVVIGATLFITLREARLKPEPDTAARAP
ncbi:MAG: DMT family transporter [Terricaulis sp.]